MFQINANLQKKLSPAQVWAIALGSIVGWGCFVLPGDVFLPNSGPLAAIIGFAVGAILLIFVAMCYSYMINYVSSAGGEYTYTYIGYGPTFAFICGWALVLGYISIIAINISALALIFRFLSPGILEFGPLYNIAGWQVYTGEVLLMMAVAIIFGFLNYLGISFAGKLQMILAIMLSGGILLLFFGTISLDSFSLSNLQPVFVESRSAITSILAIVAISPFLFVGFDTVPQTTEEFNFSPAKSKKIMLFAILWGALLYSMVTFSCAAAIPYPDMLVRLAEMRSTGNVAWATGEVAKMAYGRFGAVVICCGVAGAVCTGINGFFVASTRLLLAMARGGILPAWFGEIHPRYGSPYKSIFFCMAIVLLTPFAGRAVVGWIVDMSSVGTGIAYLFTCLVAIKVIRNIAKTDNKLPIIFCKIGVTASLSCIALLLIPYSPAYISLPCRIILMIWIIIGTIFYFISRPHWLKHSPKKLTENICGNANIITFYSKKSQ